MSPGAGLLERAADQRLTGPALAKRGLDRKWSEQQGPGLSDAHRGQPDRTDQQGADTRGKRKLAAVLYFLAQTISGLGKTPRTERALMQAIDRRRIGLGFGQDGQGNFGHGAAPSLSHTNSGRKGTLTNLCLSRG